MLKVAYEGGTVSMVITVRGPLHHHNKLNYDVDRTSSPVLLKKKKTSMVVHESTCKYCFQKLQRKEDECLTVHELKVQVRSFSS